MIIIEKYEIMKYNFVFVNVQHGNIQLCTYWVLNMSWTCYSVSFHLAKYLIRIR